MCIRDRPTGYAANTFQTQNNQQFAKEVDELTSGKLKITLHPGGSLYKANEIKRAVQTGQVPSAEFILSGAANENALYGVDSVPFLATSYAEAWRLYQAARPAQEKLLASQGMKPVSYTHLDVYKRQSMRFSLFTQPPSRGPQ